MKVVGLIVLFISVDSLSVLAPEKLESPELRHTPSQCPPDEEYRSCEPCNRTCENPNPFCPAQCAEGCFCKGEMVRNKDGVCVDLKNCTSKETNSLSSKTSRCKCRLCYNLNYDAHKLLTQPDAFELTCGAHQTYSPCKTCERVCSSSEPVCWNACSAGCFCNDGYLKAPSGQCVKLEQCPQAEESPNEAQEPNIDECSSDEIYLSCGWCEPTCREPNPKCDNGVCRRGCLCRPPLLRHHNGKCVRRRECGPQKCSDPNEEFVCRYGWCEARCDSYNCDARPRRCVLGCYCKLGLFRNKEGNCVSLLECPENNVTNPNDNHSLDTMFYNNNDSIFIFNITESNEEKLFSDIPHIYLGVPNIFPTLTLSDDEAAPKSVFDLPVDDMPYYNNEQVKLDNIVADTRKPSFRETDVGNNVSQSPSEGDFLSFAFSNERKRPRTILSMLKAGQFFIHNEPASDPAPPAEPQGDTMNHFIMKTFSEVIPQGVLPVNFTIMNFNPLWSPIEPVAH